MKKVNNKGMALISVISIIGILSILGAGVFYFSSNEVNFTFKNTKHTQAKYLARAGVEIAAKSFPSVSSSFADNANITKSNPVKAQLYYHSIADENGNMINEKPQNAVGQIDIEIYPEERSVNVYNTGQTSSNNKTQEVFVYSVTATLEGTKAKAQAYTVPPAILSSGVSNGDKLYLGWVNENGVLSDDVIDVAYTHSSQAVDKNFWQGILNHILTGSSGDIEIFSAIYNGVVSVSENDITSSKIKVSNTKNRAVFYWQASALIVDAAIDMTGQSNLAVLGINADTLVFTKPITVYRSSIIGSKAGNIILKNNTEKVNYIWFKSDVSYYYGSRKITLIPKGKYELLTDLDMISYYDMTDSERKNVLKKISDDVSDAPTSTSLTKIVWE